MTAAQARLAELQQQNPLLVGQDRVNKLFSSLLVALPPAIQDLWASGHLAVGEANVPNVLVDTERVAAESQDFVITMSSAFMQYVYAVTRTLSGNITITHDSGKKIAAVLKLEQVVEQMRLIFKVWESRAPWSDKPFQYPRFQPHQEQIEIAEGLTRGAELFMLAHEVFHVLMFISPDERPSLSGLSENQADEVLADGFATLTLFEFGKDKDLRLLYASQFFAVRLLAWLERLGCDPGASYPSAEIRLRFVRETARGMFDDDASFAFISTVAEAYNDQLEDIESRILNKGSAISQSPDRVRTRLLAVVEEHVRGRLSLEKCFQTATEMLSDVPADTLPQVALKVHEFMHAPFTAKDPNFHEQMLGTLRLIVDRQPSPIQAAFKDKFKTWPTMTGPIAGNAMKNR
jgi:hypothetical protein